MSVIHRTSAAFEQPCRSRDEDCDVDPPTEDDFSFNRGYGQTLTHLQQGFHIHQPIKPQQARARENPNRSIAQKARKWEPKLSDQMQHWPQRVQSSLTCSDRCNVEH
ncbi:LOW QUALITY PROTEIN: C6 transcription factor [Aspergillus luchuensis]|uniref:C6 transcription factor n=1 Tax=Aspergillus kawachii TaxID=1069201 RepID=A0A146EX23_ASPKA|nr:LOW QUALITY PROTEIN: C6 transcription factor [Aspergillus luchuensis]